MATRSTLQSAGYGASGDGHNQKPRRDLRPTVFVRKVQELKISSYGLRGIKLGLLCIHLYRAQIVNCGTQLNVHSVLVFESIAKARALSMMIYRHQGNG